MTAVDWYITLMSLSIYFLTISLIDHKTGLRTTVLSDKAKEFLKDILFFSVMGLKSSPTTGGRHALLLYDQFSGICRDVNMKLTKLLNTIEHCFFFFFF